MSLQAAGKSISISRHFPFICSDMSKPRRKRNTPTPKKTYSFLIFIAILLLIFGLSIYTMRLLEQADLTADIPAPSVEKTEANPTDQNLTELTNSNSLTTSTEETLDLEGFLADITADREFFHPTFTADQEGELVEHSVISLSYDEENEQPYWVGYKLTGDMLGGSHKRSNNFREDPKVSTQSAAPTDYRLSGYDRGHLAPAGDFTYSKSAMSESFYMSNMSPQLPAFNRGIWKKLEDQVRYWAKDNHEIFVVTGPVITEKELTLGQNKVTVPQYFYKVILDIHPPEYKAVAFLLKNEKSSKPLLDFAISVDSLEKFTGLDFFPMLPDTLEYRLEKMTNHEIWFK